MNKELDFPLASFLFKEEIEQEYEEENEIRSQNIAKVLSKFLSRNFLIKKDSSSDVKETALHSLGNLGLEKSYRYLSKITNLLSDPKPNVRAMAIWAVGKFGPDCKNKKIIKKCIESLEDKFWKVRTAACITIGNLGSEVIESCFPHLLESLRLGLVNRVILCETILKMGRDGERVLLEILKRMRVKDAKLICPIISSLEFADFKNPGFDFVLEELIKQAEYPSSQIRKASLETLLRIRVKLEDEAAEPSQIPAYLTFDSLKPTLELGLRDASPETRSVAATLILDFSCSALVFSG